MRERAKRASAKETYIFSGFKIRVTFVYIMQSSTLLLLVIWRYKRKYTDKTLYTLRKSIYE